MSLVLENHYHAISAAEWAVSSPESQELAQSFESTVPAESLGLLATELLGMYESGFSCSEIKRMCDERGLQQLSLNSVLCVFFDTRTEQVCVVKEGGTHFIYDSERLLHGRPLPAAGHDDGRRHPLQDGLTALKAAGAAAEVAAEEVAAEVSTAEDCDEPCLKRSRCDQEARGTDSQRTPESL